MAADCYRFTPPPSHFFFHFLLHSYPKTFVLFCFYIAILNHKQVLSLAKKNDSLMILQYSYIFIIAIIIIIINISIKVKATNRAEIDWHLHRATGIRHSASFSSFLYFFVVFFYFKNFIFSISTQHIDLSSHYIKGMFAFFLVYTLPCFHSLAI